MRIPIAATVVVVTALAGIAWHGQRRLAGLRAEHDHLVSEAANRGIHLDAAHSGNPVQNRKRPRPDRVAEAKAAAASLIAHANEMYVVARQTRVPDAATRQRMIDEMDRLTSLSGEQLKILIAELRTGWTPDGSTPEDHERGRLIDFALKRLILDHPKDALEIMTGSAEMEALAQHGTSSLVQNRTFAAVESWAAVDLEGAVNWVKARESRIGSTDRLTSAKTALIFTAAERDPALSLALIEDFGLDPKEMADTFSKWVKSPQQRLAFLRVLRLWRPRISDERLRSQTFDARIRDLAMGERYGERQDFAFTTRWMDRSDLTPAELESLTGNLQERVIAKETGKWIDWLGTKLPPDLARDRTWHLFSKWTDADPHAAGEWLATATESPAKHTAARAYAEKVFPYDPETAIQWALSVPAGDDRDQTLKRLHDAWPKDDPAGAAVFAREHGIK